MPPPRSGKPAEASASGVLFIRADANPVIGVGHVMRCLALAEAWIEQGGRAVFASEPLPPAIAERIERTGTILRTVASISESVALLREIGARVVVVDGYHFGPDLQSALAATGARLLVIDDDGASATAAAHLVLNQQSNATPTLYQGLRARLLLGTHYVLLRREFRDGAALRTVPTAARRVLVSFGGADPRNLAPRVIEAVAPLEGFDVLLIAGMANQHADELRVPAGARAAISIVPSVDDIATHMRWADLAIVAAGGTCWELAACGVPMIAVATAENQRAITAAIDELGFGVTMELEAFAGDTLRAMLMSVSSDAIGRGHMSSKGRAAIDGMGALRVAAALREAGNAQ